MTRTSWGYARGQTTVEWLGVAVAVAVLVLAIAGRADAMGGAVDGGLRSMVCTIGGGTCPPPAAASARAADVVVAGRPSVLETGQAKLFSTRTARAPVRTGPVKVSQARRELGYDDPSRCLATGEGRQACVGPNGVARSCTAVRDGVTFANLVSCSTQVDEADLGPCGLAPNERVDATASGEVLCSVGSDDGTTRILRCDAGSIAGTSGGGSTTLRACRDSADDLYAATDAARVTCHAFAKDAVGLEVDGRKVWRFTSFCTSPGGGGYACYADIDRRGPVDGLQPAHPTGQPDACDNRTVPAGLFGEDCTPTLAFRVVRCGLPDQAQVDCLLIEGTLQHCATSPRTTAAAGVCRDNGRRQLTAEGAVADFLATNAGWRTGLAGCRALPGSAAGVALGAGGQVLASTAFGVTASPSEGPSNVPVDEPTLLAAVQVLGGAHETLAAFDPGTVAGQAPPLVVTSNLPDLPLQMTEDGLLLVGSNNLASIGRDYAALRRRQREAVGAMPLMPRAPSVASVGGGRGATTGTGGRSTGSGRSGRSTGSGSGVAAPSLTPPSTGPGSLDEWTRIMRARTPNEQAKTVHARGRGASDLLRRILPLELGIRGRLSVDDATRARYGQAVQEIQASVEGVLAGADLSTPDGVRAAGRRIAAVLQRYRQDLHLTGRGKQSVAVPAEAVDEAVQHGVETFIEDNLAQACPVLQPNNSDPNEDIVITQDELMWMCTAGLGGSINSP